ncbi:MAG: ATPase [Candidatus Methanofastidiosa archaeon]|nr:ATPase [Candidatus Methanofastidiosa archaeon]
MYDTSNPPDYGKFALKRNPFTALSSEGIQNVEDIHVSQGIDNRIADILSEVIDNGAGLAISIVGNLGTGKTQRLKGINKLIKDSGGFPLFLKVDSNDTVNITNHILSSLNVPEKKEEMVVEEPKRQGGFLQALKNYFFSEPVKAEKRGPEKRAVSFSENDYDPQAIGDLIKESLSAYPVSGLILDEMENVTTAPMSDLIPFFETFRSFISNMPKGCLFVFACTPEFYKTIREQFPAFTIRLHAELKCEQLTDKKAFELVEKRLALVRTNEMSDPTFPFEDSSIFMVNKISNGNPRVLLRLMHNILASAARDLTIDLIDDRYVTRIVAVPNSIDEYILKVPEDLQAIINSIIDDFNGGPVTYIQLSKALKEPPTRVYADLEELSSMGLLRNKKGHYSILEHLKELIKGEYK